MPERHFIAKSNILVNSLLVNLSTKNTRIMKKILLLGSGELGKEFVIAAKRAGQYVVACDRYAGAPAMQVADECEVFNMLDGDALDKVVEKHSVRTSSSRRLKPSARNACSASKSAEYRLSPVPRL